MGRRDRDAAEASIARDHLMARLAATRAAIAGASATLDECLMLFVAPDDDAKGKTRRTMLEDIDELIGHAAAGIQAAQEAWEDIDPTEGEEGLEADAEGGDEDDDDDDDEKERD